MTNALAIVDAQATSELRIGVIFRDSFQVFRKGFWCFFVLTLISLLPEKFAEFLGADSDGTIILGFLRLFLLFVMQGASAYSVFQVRRGRQLSFAEAISRFLRRIAPVAGSALLATLIISVGFALLLIPGLIALVMFYVAVPACVVEELGPVTSLKRSVALSKGFRWKVFGLFLLWIPGAFFVSIGLNFIWGLVQGFILGFVQGLSISVEPAEEPMKYVATLGRFAIQGMIAAFGAVLASNAYYTLRAAKESIDIERIVPV